MQSLVLRFICLLLITDADRRPWSYLYLPTFTPSLKAQHETIDKLSVIRPSRQRKTSVGLEERQLAMKNSSCPGCKLCFSSCRIKVLTSELTPDCDLPVVVGCSKPRPLNFIYQVCSFRLFSDLPLLKEIIEVNEKEGSPSHT